MQLEDGRFFHVALKDFYNNKMAAALQQLCYLMEREAIKEKKREKKPGTWCSDSQQGPQKGPSMQ